MQAPWSPGDSPGGGDLRLLSKSLRTPTNSDVSLKSQPQPCEAFRQPQLLSTACLCPLGKKRHHQKVENYVLFGRHPDDVSLGQPSQITLRELFKEAREKPGYIGVLQQTPGSRNFKRLLLSKKTRYVKLRNSELFYVWEDARVWAH